MLPHSLRALALVLIVDGTASAAAPPRVVSFRDDVHPILARSCLRCHEGSNPKSSIRLDARSEILGESNGKPLALVGRSDKSRLLAVVRNEVPDKLMPPEGRGKRLSATEIDILRAWIDQGLVWDDAVLPPPAPPEHRFFRSVVRPNVPPSHDAFTPVDAFLAATWKEKGLRPVAEASRRVLIRRLTLDLIGLPPTPEEIDSFERDDRPDAVDRLVERLLASPCYGERWGRHWLDVARYADSEGYESNHLRSHAWRYRDWVIDAFNRDLPFADFVKLQLAGDEVSPYSDDNLIATGFLASARHSSNEEDKARQRNDILVDIVNTTATAFLGLTFNCAQCHNHKFDPITARDYYRLQAFFVRGQPANLALQAPDARRRWLASLPKGYEETTRRRDAILESTLARLVEKATRELSEEERQALALDPTKRNENQDRLAREAEVKLQFSTGRVEREVSSADRKEYESLKKKITEWEKKLPDEPQTFGYLAPSTASAKVSVLPMKGFYPLPFVSSHLNSLRSHLLIGGDVHNRAVAVEPGWPALLGKSPAKLTPTPRQALARWIADPEHPLAARVYVNRVWQWHFGRGLVATAADFGVKGSPPSHPELLDWLASEFIRTGSTKHIHRLIVGSRAYRLSSAHHLENAEIDPDNVYLWRWSPRRLESETIRDSLLACAGDLDGRMGGPGDSDESSSRRRGVYLFQKRDHPSMVNGLFDGPAASAESCPRRGVSTVPLQALYLLNNRFGRDRAKSLAERVRQFAGEDLDRQITQTFRLTLCRSPEDDERRACRQFFARSGEESLEAFSQSVLNVNEFVYLE